MNENAVFACTVKITWQRSERSLEVRGTAGGVIPFVSNHVAGARVECERIAIAIKSSTERHSRINSVVKGAFDYIGVFSIACCGEHAPIPHHVADSRAAFSIGLRVRKFIRVAERFPVASSADSTCDVHL